LPKGLILGLRQSTKKLSLQSWDRGRLRQSRIMGVAASQCRDYEIG